MPVFRTEGKNDRSPEQSPEGRGSVRRTPQPSPPPSGRGQGEGRSGATLVAVGSRPFAPQGTAPAYSHPIQEASFCQVPFSGVPKRSVSSSCNRA